MILLRRAWALWMISASSSLGQADRLVQAVAVGRFQNQVVHGRQDLGIADDRQAGAAEVAAEADAQAARQGEVRHGRAQDVAGVEKLGRHAVQGAEGAVVVAGDEMPQGLDGLLGAVRAARRRSASVRGTWPPFPG